MRIMENGSAREKWSFRILFIYLFYLCLNIKIHNDINITLDNIGLFYFLHILCVLSQWVGSNCLYWVSSKCIWNPPWHIF